MMTKNTEGISKLAYHPLADIFPMIPESEIKLLAQDIKTNGLLQKIILHENKILDGRNRYLACRMADVEPVFMDYKGKNPLGFVISANLHRRHLSESQRAVIAAKLADMEPHRPNKSANLPTSVSQPQAAKLLNVSDRSIRSVKAIERAAPEKIKEIESGQKSINQARVEIKKEKQAKERAERIKNIQNPPSPATEKKWELVLADPPWQYDFAEAGNRKIENQYETLTLPQIIDKKPPSAKDCILFLWATAPKLIEAVAVLEGWGFSYVTHAIWDKEKIGMGYWFRGQHELLLVGTKGKVESPNPENRVSSIFREPRGKHSEKPTCVYEWIENTFPHLIKGEMYARKTRSGWQSWGNEV